MTDAMLLQVKLEASFWARTYPENVHHVTVLMKLGEALFVDTGKNHHKISNDKPAVTA